MTTPPPNVDFAAMLPDSLPADDAGWAAAFRGQLQAQGSTVANTSPMSPFFRLLAAIVTWPWRTLRNWLLTRLLPNMFLATATGAALEIHATGYDEARLPATKALGVITFSRAGITGALAIPVGTVVQSPPIAGVVYRMVTSLAASIPDGASSVLVPVQAELEGAAYNLGDGYYNILATPVPGVTAVTNAIGWLTTPGRDLEGDDSLRKRCPLKLRRLTGWHTEDTYRSLIAERLAINPDNIWFNNNAPRGPATANAYFLLDVGTPTQAMADNATAHLMPSGYHGLGDDVLVSPLPPKPIDLALTITAVVGTTQAQKDALRLKAEDIIRAAFRESAAYPSVHRVAPYQAVSLYYLGVAIWDLTSEPVRIIQSMAWTTPAGDVAVGMERPTIQTLTVTVL